MRTIAAAIVAVFSVSVVLFPAPDAGAIEAGEAPRFTLISEVAPSLSETFGRLREDDAPLALSSAREDRSRVLLRPLASLTLDPVAPPASDDRPASDRAAVRQPGEGGLRYRLGDVWTAGLAYRHALLFGTSPGQILRQQQLSDFATDPDRDVLRLSMSWDLPLAQLDLGYRFESMRAEASSPGGYSLLGVLPESGRMLHALTLGVTRRWGGAGGDR